jgi:phosphatidylserine decarboxylase
VVAPAHGRGTAAAADRTSAAVTTLLGVLNVHEVRAPVEGRLVKATHREGAKRLAASKDAPENERLEMEFEGLGEAQGAHVRLTLIAGAFADRIVSYLEEGQTVAKGERVGIIKFGSRVDLAYAGGPPVTAAVKAGGTVKAAQDAVLLPARPGGPP